MIPFLDLGLATKELRPEIDRAVARVLGLPDAPAQPFAPCPARLGLYPVLPSADWVERVLDYGVKTVQLRSKQPKSAALVEEIGRCVAAGRKHADARV